MRLSYNVLWVDDNIDSLRDYKRELAVRNEKIGIVTNHVDMRVEMGAREAPQEHRDRVSKALAEVLEGQVFELIIVDLHMTGKLGGFDGPDIIEFIRDTQKIFRPIIFHSGGDPGVQATAIEQLNERAKGSGVFGKSVFISTKDGLNNTLRDIVKEMHENEHQINQVRGTLMDRVSEIDAQIIDVIMGDQIWERVPETSRNKALKKFKELTHSQLKTLERKYDEIKEMSYDEVKTYISADPKNVNTFAKTKFLRELTRTIPELKGVSATLSEFLNSKDGEPECLTEIRNEYAHQTADDLSKKHDDKHCTHIRQQAHRHTDNVLSLKSHLE